MTRQALLDEVAAVADAGQRLDTLLGARLGEPRARAQRRIAAGQVHVDGDRVAKSYRLRGGERIVVDADAPPPAPPDPEPVPIRYEDEHLLVVVKPAGLVTHPGAGVRAATMVDALRAMGVDLAPTGDPARPGIVHRLDRGTSGVLAVAKTEPARAGLVEQLRRREVERTYWALVQGVPEPAQATIDAPIVRSPSGRTRFTVGTSGRSARTHYDVEEAFGRAARLSVRLETGRTHQVRVHLSAVGHPVCGDHVYGAAPDLGVELGLRRPALHAARLGLAHPVTGRWILVEEPVPTDLERAVGRLRDSAMTT